MKQQVSPEAGAFINREALYSDYQSNDQRDSGNQRKEPHHQQEHHDQHHHQDHHDQHHHQAVHASVSQGCLADCVTDCVSIEQLTAYRDCVEFCGKTCNDKKWSQRHAQYQHLASDIPLWSEDSVCGEIGGWQPIWPIKESMIWWSWNFDKGLHALIFFSSDNALLSVWSVLCVTCNKRLLILPYMGDYLQNRYPGSLRSH